MGFELLLAGVSGSTSKGENEDGVLGWFRRKKGEESWGLSGGFGGDFG